MNQYKPAIENAQRSIVGLLTFLNGMFIRGEYRMKKEHKNAVVGTGIDIIRSCHNRDKGAIASGLVYEAIRYLCWME